MKILKGLFTLFIATVMICVIASFIHPDEYAGWFVLISTIVLAIKSIADDKDDYDPKSRKENMEV